MPSSGDIKFRIYLRRFGRLVKLFKLQRSKSGIYIFSGKSANYISYHEDGRYWIRFGNSKPVKKLRQPLSSFKGQETLYVTCITILEPMPWDRDENSQRLQSEDIVLDLDGNFGLEVAISDNAITLPTLPERLNSITYIKQCRPPFLVIEAFQLSSNMLPPPRFPSGEKSVEGVNLFFDHTGKI